MDTTELALAGTARIGESRTWFVKEKVASLARGDGGGMVAALPSEFALIDLQAGTLARRADLAKTVNKRRTRTHGNSTHRFGRAKSAFRAGA
jgi:hypothetical protein